MLAERIWRQYLQNEKQKDAASFPSSELATCSDALIAPFLCSSISSDGPWSQKPGQARRDSGRQDLALKHASGEVKS